MSYLSEHYAGKECPGDGCILCANGNDLPEGEYCRACFRGADKIFMGLHGAELDAFLEQIGMKPDELLAQFNRAVGEARAPQPESAEPPNPSTKSAIPKSVS